MAKRRADLYFGPGSATGFTPAGPSSFDNLRPAAVVRELIQNALDAAREANVRPARIRFQLSRSRRESIPGIASYESTLERAINTQIESSQGSLSRQASLVVDRIKRALEGELVDVLTVFDNGVGLDETRMNALLTDGLSVKDGTATGTYGNGHSTVIPCSDLRYVLYAGITAQGKRIGSGHAVLASHHRKGECHPRSGDGFLVREFQAGRGKPFVCSGGAGLSGLILDALKQIRSETGHGSAVIVPAFNHFREQRATLWDTVSHAAAASFFVAIEDRQLEVAVDDRREPRNPHSRTLDRDTLVDVLRVNENQQRTSSFLNGRRAFEAHQAYVSGTRHRIATNAGKIDVHLLENTSGITRVNLCRNGMWITHERDIPGFYPTFVDQVPFHAILSVSAKMGHKLHGYIRDAEGPLHESISMKRLTRKDARACRQALREVSDWLLNNTSKIQSEAYSPIDFLTLDVGGGVALGGQRSPGSYWGAPVPVTRNPASELPVFPIGGSDQTNGSPKGEGTRKPDSTPKRSRERRRPTLPSHFQIVSRPLGSHRRRIVIECWKDFTDAEVRLVVDEALDATCERHGQDSYTPAALSKVRVDGVPAPKHALRRFDGEVRAVYLGDLRRGVSVEVDVSYRLTGDFAGLPNPSLRVEVCRSVEKEEGGGEGVGGAESV